MFSPKQGSRMIVIMSCKTRNSVYENRAPKRPGEGDYRVASMEKLEHSDSRTMSRTLLASAGFLPLELVL